MFEALIQRSILERIRGVIGWIGGIIAIVTVQMSVYPTVRDSTADWEQATESFPETFREIFRMEDYTTPAGYLSTELMTFVIPLIFIGLGAGWGARLTTEDEESRAADIILGLPISRYEYFVARLASLFGVLTTAAFLFAISLVVGSSLLDMNISILKLVSASCVVLLLGLMGAGLAAAIGAATGRRAVALGVSLSVLIGAFVVYSLAPLVSLFDRFGAVNPWEWTLGTQPITSGLDLGKSAVALVLSSVLFGLAARLFATRDITN
ncbi:MAG: hypothetical protein B7C54_01030 [Acidimicrobiales bacterium mtb01]|nr:MAG: hypothetical protein B7C54_01030 [Acidimicrobiales bacterium mtb01]